VAENDPAELVRKLAESYRQIRLGKGVVSKTSQVTLALLAVWASALFRLSGNLSLDSALLGGALIASGVHVWWVRST
jgi:hypothetical protein